MKSKIDFFPPVQYHKTTSSNSNKYFSSAQCRLLFWRSPEPPLLALIKYAGENGIKLEHIKTDNIYVVSSTENVKELPRIPHELGTQGYKIDVCTNHIQGIATTETGLAHAVFRIVELLKLPKLPELTLCDWPNAERRGIMIDLARVVESPRFIISLLPFLFQCRFNQVYLYLENKLTFESHPLISHPMAWSKEEVKELLREAKQYKIDIIPMIATIGHMESILAVEEYRHLQVAETNDHLNTSLKQSQQFIFDIIKEICELFDSEYVHLAGDECPYLGKDSSETVEKYAEFINLMSEELKKYSRRGIIWADMVEKHPELLEKLSKEIILTVWKYHALDNQPIAYPEAYIKNGFDCAVAPGILADEPFLPTVERITRNLPFLPRHSGLWGVINCMWEPRTQTLPVARIGLAAAGACSWNPYGIDNTRLLKQASEFTYGSDISQLYNLLEGGEFFDMMVKSKFGFYHSFECSCNNPLVHLIEQESVDWIQLSEKINKGMIILKQSKDAFDRFKDDYNSYAACGYLARTLADCIVMIRKIGSMINAGVWLAEKQSIAAELHQLISLMKETLSKQQIAWSSCHRIKDMNFNWWFKDPIEYKIDCLSDFLSKLNILSEYNSDNGNLPSLEYFLLKFNKGSASSWNLLRIKIFYSDDGTEWKQIFYKTIPLWMDDSLKFKLMPIAGKLPKYVKLVPVYATWQSDKKDWSDMINISIGKIHLAPQKLYDEKKSNINQKYDVSYDNQEIIYSHLNC